MLHLPEGFLTWNPTEQQICVRAASQGKLLAYHTTQPAELPAWLLRLGTGISFMQAAEAFHKAFDAVKMDVREPPSKRMTLKGVSGSKPDSAVPELPRDLVKQVPMFNGGSDHIGTLPTNQFLPIIAWFDNARYKLSTCGVSESAAVRFLLTRLNGTALHHYRQHMSDSTASPATFAALHNVFLRMFSAAREYFTTKVTTFQLHNPTTAIADMHKFVAMVECSTFDLHTQLAHLQSRVRELISSLYPHLLSDALTWGSDSELSHDLPFREYVLQVLRIVQHHHSRSPPAKLAQSKTVGGSAPAAVKPRPAINAGSAKGSKPSSAPSSSTAPSKSARFDADLVLARSKTTAEVDKFLNKFERCVKCGSRTFKDKAHSCPPQEECETRRQQQVEGMIKSMEKGFHPNSIKTFKKK